MIEKMEQEMARLKLKHSLEVKVSQEVRIRLRQFHQYSGRTLLSTYNCSKCKLELDFTLPSNARRSNGNLVPGSRAFSVRGDRTNQNYKILVPV